MAKKIPAEVISPPSKATLKKYGLNLEEWQVILDRQGGVCDICKKVTSTGRLCIDHFHLKNWKKLPPDQRKLEVRGLLCWVCNSKVLFRGITIEKLKNAALYLEKHEERKTNR